MNAVEHINSNYNKLRKVFSYFDEYFKMKTDSHKDELSAKK